MARQYRRRVVVAFVARNGHIAALTRPRRVAAGPRGGVVTGVVATVQEDDEWVRTGRQVGRVRHFGEHLDGRNAPQADTGAERSVLGRGDGVRPHGARIPLRDGVSRGEECGACESDGNPTLGHGNTSSWLLLKVPARRRLAST